jgi:hypothetical protein
VARREKQGLYQCIVNTGRKLCRVTRSFKPTSPKIPRKPA